MTVFEYIMGIHSIVLGLATAILLSTIAEQLKYREVIKPYWVHSAWCGVLLFFILSTWWGYWYTLEQIENISIFEFLYTFQFSIVMYLCARLLSPDPLREQESSAEDYFFRIKTPFLLILLFGITAWSVFGLTGLLPSSTPVVISEAIAGLIILYGIFLVGIFSSNRRVHGVIVISVLVLQVIGEVSQGAIGT
jgi:hypothetical protein